MDTQFLRNSAQADLGAQFGSQKARLIANLINNAEGANYSRHTGAYTPTHFIRIPG